ncbi:hypothetical protein D3870_18230 [Noviherbaspirillum cavernae]|uniref:Uncharacterized protein n=2 Tax=Noviherbaspirillum cavernae TaxID=2320862 RepID=A0A418X5B1_9BURK|nr:hypothetical protein D3870_18230 [Noviherbaspirillum cavernae]
MKPGVPMRILGKVLKTLLIPAVVWVGFVAYGTSLDFVERVIPLSSNRSFVYATLLGQGFISAAIVSAIFSYPLAFIYRRSAPLVALCMCAPVLFLRAPDIFSSQSLAVSIVSTFEIFAYVILLTAGSWTAHTHVSRSNRLMWQDKQACVSG